MFFIVVIIHILFLNKLLIRRIHNVHIIIIQFRTIHFHITLNIICPYGNAAYRFELSVSPGDESAQKMPAVAEPSALKGGE